MGFLDSIFGGSLSGDNHSSPIGALGGKFQKWTDPIAWIPGVGDKWVDLTSNKIPEMSNKYLSKVMQPFEKIDKTINPIRRIPAVDNVGNWIANKPADTLGIVAGTIATGGALGSAMGSGASGAGGAASSAAGTSGGALGSGGGMFGNLFGSGAAATPSLSGVTAAPGVGGAGDVLGTSLAGMNVSSSFALPASQGIDYMSLLQQGQGMMGGGQEQQQGQGQGLTPMQASQLQAGGDRMPLPYQPQQYRRQPTVNSLHGLLGGIYGNS